MHTSTLNLKNSGTRQNVNYGSCEIPAGNDDQTQYTTLADSPSLDLLGSQQPYTLMCANLSDEFNIENSYERYLRSLYNKCVYHKPGSQGETSSSFNQVETPFRDKNVSTSNTDMSSICFDQPSTPKNLPQKETRKPGLSIEERFQIRERYNEKAKEQRLRMYEKAIALAEEREREQGRKHRAKRLVHFRISFKTYYGQSIFLVGSTLSLGAWEIDKAIPLSWRPGNVWATAVNLSTEDGLVEYKYIAKDANTDQILWEAGPNHVVDVTQLSSPVCIVENFWEKH